MSYLSDWSQTRGVGIQWVAAGLASVAIGGTALAISVTKAVVPLSALGTIILIAGALEAALGATVWLRWLVHDYKALRLKLAGLT
jgi:hypothetical protein